MTRRAWTSVFTAAAMAIALPVYAQDDKGSQGQRPNWSESRQARRLRNRAREITSAQLSR